MDRAAARTSSTGPQRGGALKVHASTKRLEIRFTRTIADSRT
jgi:hypothetical protein